MLSTSNFTFDLKLCCSVYSFDSTKTYNSVIFLDRLFNCQHIHISNKELLLVAKVKVTVKSVLADMLACAS